MTVDPFVDAALNCRTRADVDALEALLRERLDGPQDRFLGDSEANWSAVSSPADAAAVLFERVTNMWDALLEMAAQRAGRDDWATPAAAAAELFGIDAGVGGLDDASRDAIARLSTIALHDSDDSAARPTISFRDHGIGLAPDEMPNTILSLQRSNKLRKPYLHGLFGKGGSSACVFSDATIVVTRKQPDLLAEDEADRIGVAVVREDDAPDVGLPYYRYLVGADGCPFSVPASAAPDFEPGTMVVHVNYQAGRLGITGWQFEESVYAHAETILFRPTLPYSLHDARTGPANRRPEGRQRPSSLSGLGQRLEKSRGDGLLAHSNWTSAPVVDVGDVRLRWWLFADPDHRRKRAAKGYAVIFTSNGQVHHTWDQTRFQHLVEGRRRVALRLIAEVNCDGLDLKMRAKVFDSFRTQVRKGPEGRGLEEAVADALAHDVDLEERESDFTRQFLQNSSQDVSEAFRRRLNKAINVKFPGLRAIGGAGGTRRVPKPKALIELYDEPTTFTGPEKMTVIAGGRASAYLEVNAKDGFVPDVGSVTATTEPEGPALQFGFGDLRRGRLRLIVVAPESAPNGVFGVDLALTWTRPSGRTARLEWTIKVDVVDEQPQRKPSGKRPRRAPVGDVAFIWSNPREQETWTSAIAGELQEIRGPDLADRFPGLYRDLRSVPDLVPTIVLNEEFKDYAAYRQTIVTKLGDRQMDERKERYGLALGVTVANLFTRERDLRRRHEQVEARGTGTAPAETPMTDEQLLRATSDAARGVLALMPEFDALLGDVGDATPEDG